MNLKTTLLLLFLLLISSLQMTSVEAKERKSLNTESFPGEGLISKKTWFRWVRKDLTDDICRPDSYAMSCFSFSEKKCKQEFFGAMTNCWGRESTHWKTKKMDPRGMGVFAAYRLGQCAGNKIEAKFSKIKKPTSQCQNMSYWMGRSH